MMREIKFRGKATVPHEDMGWVYGSLVIGPVFNSIHFTTSQGPQSVLVDWRGIGQYTGLKDKNGMEIYEGDVVSCSTFRGVVKYNSYTASFQVVGVGGWGTSLEYDKPNPFEVTGNIFDNPELKERFWTVWDRESNE